MSAQQVTSDPLTIIHGDALSSLRTLESESVQMCVTSPPYWGLRDYGVEGQMGIEKTPEEYVARIAEIFHEVRRVLKNDGTLWLNLGDSYATGGGAVGRCPGGGEQGERFLRAGMINTQPNRMPIPGLKPKDLVGIPWRVAFALQADGWWLRSEITWCKRAPMPESVTDRPTSATEKLFLLSKSEKYLYNKDAVRLAPIDAEDDARRIRYRTSQGQKSQPSAMRNGLRERKPFGSTLEGGEYGRHHLGEAIPEKQRRTDKQRGHSRRHAGFTDRWDLMEKAEQLAGGANLRNYWVLSPDPFPEAHFATFPREIPRRCIALGSNAGDVVLDSFAGSGTTGKIAIETGRRAILIELKAEYVAMIKGRCATTIGLPL